MNEGKALANKIKAKPIGNSIIKPNTKSSERSLNRRMSFLVHFFFSG